MRAAQLRQSGGCDIGAEPRIQDDGIVLLALAVAGIPASLRAEGNGTLNVTSFPSGAKVSIDGVDTGKVTPMNISASVGDHVVVVSIPRLGESFFSPFPRYMKHAAKGAPPPHGTSLEPAKTIRPVVPSNRRSSP